MSYHVGMVPTNVTRRARVGVTTVFYTPGQALPGTSTAPPVYQAPSAPVAYRIPANLITPAVSSSPAVMLPGPVYTPPAAPGNAVTTTPTPGSIDALSNFLAAQASQGAPQSTAAQATTPPPALTGPVSEPDGSPAGPSVSPLVLLAIVAGLYFLLK